MALSRQDSSKPRAGRLRRARLWRRAKRLAIGVIAVILFYTVVIELNFRTPRNSHWLDHKTLGDTPYFHFLAGLDDWEARLPVDPPMSTNDSYRLAIIELDEFGDFFQSEQDPSKGQDYQLRNAKAMLAAAGQADGKPVALFLFVHGWRHNAAPGDGNLEAFKTLLGTLARSSWLSSEYSVCGVYVGWRGASVRKWGLFTKPAELLSFWQRKAVAQRISSTVTSSAIFGLVDEARAVAPDPDTNPSRIVLAGHSLGAGILMNSVSQALAYEYARASSKRREGDGSIVQLESPANLVVLLNPAMESVYLRQLRASIRPVQTENLYPWVVSLTSESDWITETLFPLAHTWPFGNETREAPYLEYDWRDYVQEDTTSLTGALPDRVWVSQSVYAKETPGHNSYMRDLHLEVAEHSDDQVQDWADYLGELQPTADNVMSRNAIEMSKDYFFLPGKEDWRWYGSFAETRPKDRIHPLFQVATVDSSIMKGHELPFDDDQRRDRFVATLMVLLTDSRFQYANESALVKIAVSDSERGAGQKAANR